MCPTNEGGAGESAFKRIFKKEKSAQLLVVHYRPHGGRAHESMNRSILLRRELSTQPKKGLKKKQGR